VLRSAFPPSRASSIAITTTAILAVGIGMAIAMSTIVRTVIIQRLPVENQQQLVVLHAFVDKRELLLSTDDFKAFAQAYGKSFIDRFRT
jgi:hypothetical protein